MACAAGPSAPYVNSGIRQDLKMLLLKFTDANSLRLPDFAHVFREAHFHEILRHRFSPAELMEFAENLLFTAGQYFRCTDEVGRQRSIGERIFGVYTCYAIYHIQVIDHVCQIRVTTEQLGELYELENYLLQEHHLDAVACIHKLIAKNAFVISMFHNMYDPATHKRSLQDDVDAEIIIRPEIPFESMKTMVNSEIFKEMEYLHHSYIKGKSDLGLTEKSFNRLSDKNPLEELNSIVQRHEKKLQSVNDGKGDDELEEFASPAATMPLESAGTSRSNLRSKAYSSNLKHTRARRHLDPNMDANFGHLTLGQLAQEIAEEESEPTVGDGVDGDTNNGARFTNPAKKGRPRKSAKRQNEDTPIDADELARRVLEEANREDGIVFGDFDESNVGKTAKQEPDASGGITIGVKISGTSGTSNARVVAPKRKKDAKLVSASPRKKAATKDTTFEANMMFSSPPKEAKPTTAPKKSKVKEEIIGKYAQSAKEKAADKAFEKLRNRMKIEEIDVDDC